MDSPRGPGSGQRRGMPAEHHGPAGPTSGRDVVDYYIIEMVLADNGTVLHTIERDGEKWLLVPEVAETLQRHRRRLTDAKTADDQAVRILARYGQPVDEE